MILRALLIGGLFVSACTADLAAANQIIMVPLSHLRAAEIAARLDSHHLYVEAAYTYEMAIPGQMLPVTYLLPADSTMGAVTLFRASRSVDGRRPEALECKPKPGRWRCRVDSRGATTLRIDLRYERKLLRKGARLALLPEPLDEDPVDTLSVRVVMRGPASEWRFNAPLECTSRSDTLATYVWKSHGAQPPQFLDVQPAGEQRGAQ